MLGCVRQPVRVILLVALVVLPVSGAAAPGDLDTTFGTGRCVLRPLPVAATGRDRAAGRRRRLGPSDLHRDRDGRSKWLPECRGDAAHDRRHTRHDVQPAEHDARHAHRRFPRPACIEAVYQRAKIPIPEPLGEGGEAWAIVEETRFAPQTYARLHRVAEQRAETIPAERALVECAKLGRDPEVLSIRKPLTSRR